MNLANKISVFRILLIPFFVLCIVYYKPEHDILRFFALAFFLIAVLTDAVDGYFARAKKQGTVLGTFLDPIADKLLLVTAFISLSVINDFPRGIKLPLWVPIIIISRDIIIILGIAVIYVILGNVQIAPSRLGKIATFFQMATIIGVLLQLSFSYIIWILAIFFTVISAIGYILRSNRILNGSH